MKKERNLTYKNVKISEVYICLKLGENKNIGRKSPNVLKGKRVIEKHSKCEDDLTVKEIEILESSGMFPIMESENIIYLKKRYSFGERSL